MKRSPSHSVVLAATVLFQVMTIAGILTSCTEEPPPKPVEVPKSKERDYEQSIMHPASQSSMRRAVMIYMPAHRTSSNWHDYVSGAEKALAERDYDAAEYLLDAAVRLAPNQGELYDLRGRARSNSSRTNNQMALEDLLKAKELNSLSGSGYGYMARLYDGDGKTDKAIEVLNEAIKKFPLIKDLYKSRAAMHTAKKNIQKAKEDYDKTIGLDKEDSLSYLLRAQSLESLGKYEDALKDYAMATKHRSRDRLEKRTIAHKSRAMLLAKLGRHKEAIEESKNLTGTDNDEDMMRFRGDQYLALKMYQMAIAEYTASIEMAPDLARSSYEARAKAYSAMGKFDLAEADRAAAKKLDETPAERTLYKFK